MNWIKHRHLCEHCGDVPPAELEVFYYGEQGTTRIAEYSNQKVSGLADAIQNSDRKMMCSRLRKPNAMLP
ncbi:hypothetical protein DVG80_20650 [Rhodococcus erythropolis]|nr:hypothetical protein DVG80_20650 [Rhodococcus erythropolis]